VSWPIAVVFVLHHSDRSTFTTPHQGFIFIQPSVLCLARFTLMDRTLASPSLLASHPTVTSDARRNRQQAFGHLPGPFDHSIGATSCRTQKKVA
jgi:hypothetical protein